jgi:uncharacterized membrane protein
MRGPWALVWILLAAAVAQCAYYYPRLPDPVASHFGWDGRPDGWTSRAVFFIAYLGVLALSLGLLYGVARLIRSLPDGLINIPHREHWLSPVRREATLDFVQRRLGWCAAATVLFLLIVFQDVIVANRTGAGFLATGRIWLVLGLLVAVVAGVSYGIHRKFSRPPGPGEDGGGEASPRI